MSVVGKGICQGCKKPVKPEEDFFEVAGKEYHDPCFNCFSCKKNMAATGAYIEERGLPFCADACVSKYLTGSKTAAVAAPAAASAPVMMDKCDGCGVQFANKEEYVSLKSKESDKKMNFHDKCFVCAECKQPIGTQAYGVSNGKPIHEGCSKGAIVSKTQGANEFTGVTCYACGAAITGRKKTIPGKGDCHLTCAPRCARCGLGVSDTFFMDGENVICHRAACQKK